MAVPSSKPVRRRGHIDYTLVMIIIFMMAFGLIILYSASYYEASMSKACKYNPAFYLKKQLTWMIAGFVAMIIVSYIPYRIYKRFSIPAFIFSILLVFGCLFFEERNGARRWIYIGGFSIQPAEIVKITTILLMATFIVRLGTAIYHLKTAFKMLCWPLAASMIIYLVTKNLSSAIIVFVIAFGMFFVARPDYGKFILIAFILLTAVAFFIYYIAHNVSMADVQDNFRLRRVVAWLNPDAYASSGSFQSIQALYAIGSGGLFGKGLGRSMQKLGYIPEVQNDMIFSVICEELGIFGAIAVIAMFVLLCWRLKYIADNARDVFGSYIAVGVFCHIASQAILNIAVATNTIPNTGVSLPFISYGGSAILFTLIEMGIVLNVARNSNG